MDCMEIAAVIIGVVGLAMSSVMAYDLRQGGVAHHKCIDETYLAF